MQTFMKYNELKKKLFFLNIRPRVFNSYFSFILILLYVKRENQLTSTVFFHPLTAPHIWVFSGILDITEKMECDFHINIHI